ncbi:MAG: hypothetical protein P8185_15035 [Deltaproteobacteria bacterium]
MSGEKYVLLKWKDGWQEVVRIDGDAVGFDKYFVIERKEYFGRLVYKMPEGKYPGLVVIDRAPMELEKMVMMEAGEAKRFNQTSTYKEGDRIEYNFEMENEKHRLVDDVGKKVKEALSANGVSAKDILAMPEKERFKEIEAIARQAGIVGSRNQEDVVGFIRLILEKI